MQSDILKQLNIPDLSILKPAVVGPKRMRLVAYAHTLEGGTIPSPREHKIWSVGTYQIGFRKPGKEADPSAKTNHKDGSKAPNPKDMTPTVWESGKILKVPASFEEIFHVFEHMLRTKEDGPLELLAGIFYRSAYMLDFDMGEATPAYNLPKNWLEMLERPIKEATGLPADVYLKYLQLIAWNEDVKYNALGYNIAKEKTGRQGNLLTYTHLIAVLLGKLPLSIFCYGFARGGGVSPLSGKQAAVAFSWLRAEKAPKKEK